MDGKEWKKTRNGCWIVLRVIERCLFHYANRYKWCILAFLQYYANKCTSSQSADLSTWHCPCCRGLDFHLWQQTFTPDLENATNAREMRLLLKSLFSQDNFLTSATTYGQTWEKATVKGQPEREFSYVGFLSTLASILLMPPLIGLRGQKPWLKPSVHTMETP